MKETNTASIDLRDRITLLAVWEINNGYWRLVLLTRMKQAIALWREKPCNRLVFPCAIKPEGLWGGSCKKRRSANKQKCFSKHEQVQPSKAYPVQTQRRTAAAASLRKLPPVKVYFVDPKIL